MALVTVALVQIVAEPQRGDGDAVELLIPPEVERASAPTSMSRPNREQERRPQIGEGGMV